MSIYQYIYAAVGEVVREEEQKQKAAPSFELSRVAVGAVLASIMAHHKEEVETVPAQSNRIKPSGTTPPAPSARARQARRILSGSSSASSRDHGTSSRASAARRTRALCARRSGPRPVRGHRLVCLRVRILVRIRDNSTMQREERTSVRSPRTCNRAPSPFASLLRSGGRSFRDPCRGCTP